MKIVQTAACLEIVHSMLGVVKSPAYTVFLQGIYYISLFFLLNYYALLVFSRVWTIWAVMNNSVVTQQSIFFPLAITSWAVVEVPRYLFYALNILEAVPYPLFWLRYSLFAILYPIGLTGELGSMTMAVQELKGDLVNSICNIVMCIDILIIYDRRCKIFFNYPVGNSHCYWQLLRLDLSLHQVFFFHSSMMFPMNKSDKISIGCVTMYQHLLKARKKQFALYAEEQAALAAAADAKEGRKEK